MPPKKQDVPVPEVEDEVDLPEDLLQELGGSYPAEPQFCLVLGHLAGHSFRVPSEEEGGPPQDFDPCAVLLNQVKQSGDAAKSIVLLDKEELQGYCTEAFGLQDQPLWAGLKFRLEKERAARQRQKSNALRRKLISEFEDPELKAAGGEGEVSPPEVDALFLLDAPADAEELQAMSDAGLYEVVDLWTNIYFAGETLDESEPPVQVECPMGEVPQLFFQAIGSAAASTDLANCTVSVVPESHQLAALEAPQDSAEGAEAPPAVTTTPVERVTAAMMEVLAQEASSRMRFQAWLQAPRVTLPEGTSGIYEDRLYHSMMSAVSPPYHDIPLFLHCLTDQVERTLSGEAQLKEDQQALKELEEHLAKAFQDAICEGPAIFAPREPPTPKDPQDPQEPPTVPGLPDSGPLLPYLDRAACYHRCGPGAELDGKPVLASVHEVLDKVSVPRRGVGLPAAATFSAVERKALRHRFYPFAPSVSPHELEQMLLLHAFQDLMLKAAPERSWCFADRRWRELIPKSLFGQCLEEALKSEPFVDTAYLPRHDCLLLVLHHRSVPGQVLWHAWHGDVLAKAQDPKWSQPSLVTLPTYNDWSKVHGGSEASANVSILENLDAREIGYNAIVEKLACPEGSVILVTSMELGLQSSFGSREPRQTRRLARVMKGGLTFGMAVDETWKRWQESSLQKARDLAQEPPSEEGAEEPGAPAPEPVEPFPDSRLGSVWVSLPSGSRVTLRLHHEGVEGLWELSQAEHPLPKMGAMMTYAANDGQLVQVFSDGSVRFTAAEQATNSLPTQGLTSYFPGCPEDYEVSRTIRSGTLIKQLVSGRVEIFHADGTTAFRNPTEEELQQRQGDGVVPSSGSQRKLCEEAKKEDLLKRMHQVYQDTFVDPEASKHVGLPGHWVTLHTDGSVVGRGEDGEEYEMEAVATALQVDLLTRHRALTNSRGFASFEDPEGQQKVCVYPDGTRITWTCHESSQEVELFKAYMPLARCELVSGEKSEQQGAVGTTQVECADGTSIEVIPSEGGHEIVLTCREGNMVKSSSDGHVEILVRQDSETPNYVADCREGKLVLCGAKGDFVLHADQTLEVPVSTGGASSPRCQEANKAYDLALEGLEPPPLSRAPRLFVLHGNGEAEELLGEAEAKQILEAARGETTALVLGPEDLGHFKCHTIFHTRLPDTLAVPQMGSVALPDSLDGAGSMCSVISEASQQASCEAASQAEAAQAGTVTEFRQLLEFPEVSEEDQIKLQGTLKQYVAWEAAELKKMRDAAKPPEPKKTKKDKGKEKVKEKGGKKGKKNKNEPEVVEEVQEVPPEPAFVQGLKLSAFEHHVKVLQGRANEQLDPSGEELLSRALATLAVSLDDKAPEGEAEEQEKACEDAEEEVQAKAPTEDPDLDQENIAPSKAEKKKRGPSVAETEWSFAYFKSDTGLQFLMDTGMLDPDKPQQAVVKEKRPRPPPAPLPRSPWYPRLVGEPEDEPEEEASPTGEDQEEWPGQPKLSADFNVPEFGALHEDDGEKLVFQPGDRFPIAPVQDEAPVGPHPDKKAPMWDVYGEPRGPKGKISQAYVGVNTDYLEVEGPTGRKINTSALAHKRSEVKGLGDNHMMVEIVPGACRFGLLRQGSLYRMHFYIRNLEVDVTRFNVRVPDSKFIRLQWQPGQLAPGMAAKVSVEMLATEQQRIEQLVEIVTKAHVIRVPITARIIGAEEYDRLDAESLALHGRRIGRHRERSETHRPGPVQLITEPIYCKKVMGAAWQPLPSDLEEAMATDLLQ